MSETQALPLVSIIMPVYNRTEFIREAIESLIQFGRNERRLLNEPY